MVFNPHQSKWWLNEIKPTGMVQRTNKTTIGDDFDILGDDYVQ